VESSHKPPVPSSAPPVVGSSTFVTIPVTKSEKHEAPAPSSSAQPTQPTQPAQTTQPPAQTTQPAPVPAGANQVSAAVQIALIAAGLVALM
jgi:hypothetical protein